MLIAVRGVICEQSGAAQPRGAPAAMSGPEGLGRGSRAQLLTIERQNTNHWVLGSTLALDERCHGQAALSSFL